MHYIHRVNTDTSVCDPRHALIVEMRIDLCVKRSKLIINVYINAKWKLFKVFLEHTTVTFDSEIKLLTQTGESERFT